MIEHATETSSGTDFTSAASLWLVLMKAYRSMEAYIEGTVSAQGIGLSDFMILEMLLHKGPMSMSQIGDKVLLANPSMTAAADRLAKLGYISRCSGTADRRVRTIELTKDGRKVIRRIFAQHEQDLEEVMSEVCPSMREPVRTALKRIGLAAKAKTAARAQLP